jgi:hypothetical protein
MARLRDIPTLLRQIGLLIGLMLLCFGVAIAGSTYTNFDVPGAINTSGTSINPTG